MRIRHASGISRRFSKAALIAALALLIAVCAFAFAACDDKSDGISAEERRAAAVAAFEKNVLSAFNEDWTPGMSMRQVADLDERAGYVEAHLWVGFVADVLSSSALQTAKIELMAARAADEESKQVFTDIVENADALMELVDEMGFTSADVADIGFAMLRASAGGVVELYMTARQELAELKNFVYGSERAEIEEAQERAERVVNSSLASPEAVEETVAALDEAESGIRTLLGFLYDTERIFGTGSAGDGLASLLNGVSSGALGNISDHDMFVWLDSLVTGLKEFAEDMSADAAQVKAALVKVNECFDGFEQPVDVVDELMTWTRYAAAFAEDIPEVAETAAACFGALYEKGADGGYTYAFVRKLKDYASEANSGGRGVNALVIAAEMVRSLTLEKSEEEIASYIGELASGGTEKRLLLYALTMFSSAYGDENTSMDPNDYALMTVTLLSEVFLQAFENAYRDYLLYPEEYENRVRNWARVTLSVVGGLEEVYEDLGIPLTVITVDLDAPITAEWKNTIVSAVNEVIGRLDGETTGSLAQRAAAALVGQIGRLYGEDASALGELADSALVSDTSSPEAERITELAGQLPFIYIAALAAGM